MSLSSVELLARFARDQAFTEARLVVQGALYAGALPDEHPLKEATGLQLPGLVVYARIRASLQATRLGLAPQEQEAQLFAKEYLQAFLAGLRQELLDYLSRAGQGEMPACNLAAVYDALEALERLLCRVLPRNREPGI